MKDMKYNLMVAVAALSVAGFSSCDDDDFLTEKPKTIYTTANAFQTTDQVQAAITNLYSHIRYQYQTNSFFKGDGSDVMDTPYFRSSGNGVCDFASWSTSYGNTRNVYNAYFQLASYANEALVGLNTEGLNYDSEAQKREMEAEILFFRGYAYLSLGELFGGVSLVDKFYETLKLDFTRSSRAETYEFAINDLTKAAEGLSKYPKEAGRVSQGTAYHFLAEAYLALATERGNSATELQKAIECADKVIALHPLMTQRFGSRAQVGGGVTKNGIAAYVADGDVYFDLFQEGNYDYAEGNTEAVWTLENDYAVQHEYGGNNFTENPRTYSSVARDVAWKSQYMESGASAGPWKGGIDTDLFPGGNVCAVLGGRGVAFHAPTNYVIQEVWAGDFAQDMRNSSVNIRRALPVLDQNHSLYGQLVDISYFDDTQQSISEFYPVWTKWAPLDDWGYDDLADGGNRSNVHSDQYACRSAETYLIRAEAKFRKQDAAGAAQDINALRQRANCSRMIQAGEVSIQTILDERVRELFWEERRWNTLLRMGQDGINSINKHAMYIVEQPYWGEFLKGKSTKAPITKWTLWPIPQNVIDANTGAVIEQNPGWE